MDKREIVILCTSASGVQDEAASNQTSHASSPSWFLPNERKRSHFVFVFSLRVCIGGLFLVVWCGFVGFFASLVLFFVVVVDFVFFLKNLGQPPQWVTRT